VNPPRIIALIPARGGSKRLPKKNTRLLNGEPLLSYAIAAAQESGIFERIVVSSDDSYTIVLAASYGAVGFTRPEAYATDNSPDIEWVNHAIGLNASSYRPVDAFCILRPTSPFRRGDWIARAWVYLQANPHADSLRALRPVSEHPGKMWSTSASGRIAQPVLPYRTSAAPWHSCPTQELPRLWVQTAALEIAWARVLPDSISGDVVLPWLCERDAPECLDINQPEDFAAAERLAAEHPEWLPEVSG
jgi:CMP-N,N'-diacetyllegionaminic acid synthase